MNHRSEPTPKQTADEITRRIRAERAFTERVLEQIKHEPVSDSAKKHRWHEVGIQAERIARELGLMPATKSPTRPVSTSRYEQLAARIREIVAADFPKDGNILRQFEERLVRIDAAVAAHTNHPAQIDSTGDSYLSAAADSEWQKAGAQ